MGASIFVTAAVICAFRSGTSCYIGRTHVTALYYWHAVKNIDATMLMRVWQALEYRIDVCRVTPW
jgi:hypothetical protein